MKKLILIIGVFMTLVSCERETSKINDMGTLNITNSEKPQPELKETYTLQTESYTEIKRGAPFDENVIITFASGTIAELFGITSGYVKFDNIEDGRSYNYPYMHVSDATNGKDTQFPVDKVLEFSFYEELNREKVWRYTGKHIVDGVERPIKIAITSKKKGR